MAALMASAPAAAAALHLAPPNPNHRGDDDPFVPTMADIMASSRSQGLHIELRTAGPFFRVHAVTSSPSSSSSSAAAEEEVGRAEGVIRPWIGGDVLHLDSMRMSRATLGMDRSIFGLGLFLGAVAVRHGFDRGCPRAELLAINDSPLYHSKLVRFYTRMGFSIVHEVDGSSIRDLAHMLVWGGRGTRMDADIEQLLIRWGKRFKPKS
ncbi:hypothetical protein ACMD2_19740 [Ananas comosus]|uniref:N-acetyltransferase domain-containing protein n=1 Tax=Ananas comosus TaxID=4615 RepID=A0A199W8P5_ANACO|nr:hypothetical protein ACMD2_19740 [Ananas comosus]